MGLYLLGLKGVPLDVRDAVGDTALHVAFKLAKSSEAHEEFSLILVRHGADTTIETKDGRKGCEKLVDETNSNRFKVKWKGLLLFYRFLPLPFSKINCFYIEAVQFANRQKGTELLS